MLAIVKRILDLAGSFSASSRRSLVVGMACNVLKALFMAGMLAAVWWALENRDRLGAEVALQCFGMLALSVAGQFAFQYLVDIKMDAEGFHVFRDLRLRVGDRLKGAPMGYFSEQRLSAITTTLTTTVHQLEEFMTICLTGLSGGVAMAVIWRSHRPWPPSRSRGSRSGSSSSSGCGGGRPRSRARSRQPRRTWPTR